MDREFTLPDGTMWVAGGRGHGKSMIKEGASKPDSVHSVQFEMQTMGHHVYRLRFLSEKQNRSYWLRSEQDKWVLCWPGNSIELGVAPVSTRKTILGSALSPLKLTMPGKVVKIQVKEGDLVNPGDCIMVVEAMKMENNLLAKGKAKIKKILVQKDDRLESGSTLVTFEVP